MTIRHRLPFMLALLGALAFGLAAGWLHGNEGGLRAALANVVAPWLFVAIIPAWWAGSTLRGAVLGTTTTMVALVGYYLALTWAMFGHLGTTHGLVHSFAFVLMANQIWFVAGLISGPICGAVAGFFGARVRPAWLELALGLLMIGEATVVFACHGGFVPILNAGWGASDPRAYLPELMLGFLALLAAASADRQATAFERGGGVTAPRESTVAPTFERDGGVTAPRESTVKRRL